MARIEGVDLPRNKRVEIGLTYIHGIGRTTARNALVAAGVGPDRRVRDLTEEEITSLRETPAPARDQKRLSPVVAEGVG